MWYYLRDKIACDCEGVVTPDCSSNSVSACHQLSAKGCANVNLLIAFCWSVCYGEYVKVLQLKAEDAVAVTEEVSDSSCAPAHPPAFTLTLIQTEKTTHSSDTNAAT